MARLIGDASIAHVREEQQQMLMVVAENYNHDHPPETAQATVAKLVDKMKERARNETVSLNRIYREAVEEINSNPEPAELASVLPTLPSLKSSLCVYSAIIHFLYSDSIMLNELKSKCRRNRSRRNGSRRNSTENPVHKMGVDETVQKTQQTKWEQTKCE